MRSVLLVWDTGRPDAWASGYGPAVAAVAATGESSWRCPPAQNLQAPAAPGDEVWLFAAGSTAGGGLLGHGFVPGEADATGGPAAGSAGAGQIRFDLLLPLGEHLPVADLRTAVPEVGWGALRTGGTVPPAGLPPLRRAWSVHLASLDLAHTDPLAPLPGTTDPRVRSARPVNRYEHDAAARRVCLAFHGGSCAACGIVPRERYGPGAEHVLQIHHLLPGADLSDGYELDPVSDLVPLCPTCHAVAHTRVPVPYTPAEVRRMLAGGQDTGGFAPPAAGPVPGSVVNAHQQQSLEDAAKLRGLR
ncbi:restriction endonuclease [Arthrobacter zhangbolii]|uniref:Restriction endonuclease n=1 Tax=Arthrobacter zhangbolii TaxID=2886936 RepID=A0A9X1M9M2_9MICC|nr:restriction endonuclease [Arthrobacter zhangbolii]MCC3273440.1 restriction endonuclease [Arthrobacter zhangbolii]UON92586.1 restriction endonuclease [Arthrobacter zhangbolii]